MSNIIVEGVKWKNRVFFWVVLLLFILVSFFVFNFLFSDKVDQSVLVSDYDYDIELISSLSRDNSDYFLIADDYSSENILVNISNFEESDEKWQGMGVYDSDIVYEGKRSLSLFSIDGEEVYSYFKKSANLESVDYFELMLHLSDRENFESVSLKFGDIGLVNYYQYTFSNLVTGWNLVRLPKEQFKSHIDLESGLNWNNIEQVQFDLSSRPDSVVIVRLDNFIGLSNKFSEFIREWKVNSDLENNFLSFYNKDNTFSFVVRNNGTYRGILNNLSSVRDFIFSGSVSPQYPGRTGLFLRGNHRNGYGYYFFIGGLHSNEWEVKKRSKAGWEILASGVLGNSTFLKDSDYFLRVEFVGSEMTCYLSYDNVNFLKLAELKDSEFRSGGLGVAVVGSNNWSLFKDFFYKKL